jgi:hypothetical protein
MARGFESKAVADQQEAAADAPAAVREGDPPDPALLAHRRRLELSRVDIAHRLETASALPHREMLQRALEALDSQIAALG